MVYSDGNVMNWEEFGNYHYGYVGRAHGYSEGILLTGSEFANGTPLFGENDYNEITDQVWIRMGYADGRK